jgi:hypothetical protein
MKRVAEISQALIATGRYHPKPPETYCNFFVRDIALERGYSRLKELTANQQIALMDGSPEWNEVQAETAQALANQDKFVVAGWANTSGGHGHVCVIVPGDMQMSGKWNRLVPVCANVAPEVFYGKPVSFAFSKEKRDDVRYFVLLDGGSPGGY